MSLILRGLIYCAALQLITISAQAQSIITVSNLDDSGPGSLRSAISTASSGDWIHFDSLLTGVINLGSKLNLNKSIHIQGPGPDFLQLDGAGATGVFQVSATSIVHLEGLTISNGVSNFGGGIKNSGFLELTDVVVQDCNADYGGGIASAGGFLTMLRCELERNTSAVSGGAIYMQLSVNFLDSVTIRDNQAATEGGGIYLEGGSLSFYNSVLCSNNVSGTSGKGAGASIHGDLLSGNCAIDSNYSAGDAGGLYLTGGTHLLKNCNVSFNDAGNDFGGIMVDAPLSSLEETRLSNCVIDHNTAVYSGGGIGLKSASADYQLVLDTSQVILNLAQLADGGGIFLGMGKAEMYNCLIAQNRAFRLGGGIFVDSIHSVSLLKSSSVYANTSDTHGGGIYAMAPVRAETSTISSNLSFGDGAGIYSDGRVELSFCTVAMNTAFNLGGGLYKLAGTSEIDHTIITDNTSFFGSDNIDWLEPLFSLGFNILGIDSPALMPVKPSDRLRMSAYLDEAGSPDGLTFSHEPLPGSPAIDFGSASISTHLDQHGNPKFGSRVDIGAFELSYCQPPINPASIFGTASVTVFWDPVPSAVGYQIKGGIMGSTATGMVISLANNKTIGSLLPATTYEWQVKAQCLDGSQSVFSAMDTFTTPSARAGNTVSVHLLSDNLFAFWDANYTNWQIYSLSGKLLRSGIVNSEEKQMEVNLSSLASGIYLFELRNNFRSAPRRDTRIFSLGR